MPGDVSQALLLRAFRRNLMRYRKARPRRRRYNMYTRPFLRQLAFTIDNLQVGNAGKTEGTYARHPLLLSVVIIPDINLMG